MGSESETRERSLGMPSPLSSESTGRTSVLATFQKGFDRMNSDVMLARQLDRRQGIGFLVYFFNEVWFVSRVCDFIGSF